MSEKEVTYQETRTGTAHERVGTSVGVFLKKAARDGIRSQLIVVQRGSASRQRTAMEGGWYLDRCHAQFDSHVNVGRMMSQGYPYQCWNVLETV